MKKILDACCGSRMFWFDRENPNVIFADNREIKTTLCDGRRLLIKPDIKMDFRDMPYKDNSFKVVVFDPPHLIHAGTGSWLAKKYGILPNDWKTYLKAGFDECMRVLEPDGVLVFKWNEDQIKLNDVLKEFGKKPLLGDQRGNGFDEYVYVACTKGDVCPICKGLDDKHFKVDDMMPGENAPPMHPNCHCSTAAYMDNEAYEEWINSYQEHGLNFETWKQLHEEETYESEMGRRLVNRITGISKQKKIFNEGLKTASNEDVKTLLKQSLGRTEIARSSGRKSYYSAKEKKVYLSKDAKSDTIAHELFHEIDDTYALVENGMLKNSVQQDYRRLQNQAKGYGKSIEEMLYLEYPEAFEVSKYGIKFKEEYRGISDILNGMSNGDILMGYSHKTDYWKKSGRLEKESWAQYGRMFYTDGKALEMVKKIFPEMSQEIEQRIRRLMK